jgi:hypothetical protein
MRLHHVIFLGIILMLGCFGMLIFGVNQRQTELETLCGGIITPKNQDIRCTGYFVNGYR